MSTPEAPTSPAQQSPSRWRRVRSRLGLCIAWLVLLVLCIVWPLYLTVEIALGRRDLDLIGAGIGGAAGLTVALIIGRLRGLPLLGTLRGRRRREAAD